METHEPHPVLTRAKLSGSNVSLITDDSPFPNREIPIDTGDRFYILEFLVVPCLLITLRLVQLRKHLTSRVFAIPLLSR